MTRQRRKHIGLLLSLLMTALLFCQGMAQASVAGSALPKAEHVSLGISCHDLQTEEMTKTSPACPTNCQHQDKASDSSPQLSVLPHITPVIAFLLPSIDENAGAIQQTALVSTPPDPDPPPVIRFHRFRE